MAAQTSQGGRETLSRQRVLAGVVTLGVVAVVLSSVVVLSGAPATPAQAQYSGPTEISSWTDLDAVREDLDGDYILVNDLNETTPGYNEIVTSNTASKFSETVTTRVVNQNEITLTRTPLDTVTATTTAPSRSPDLPAGAEVNVTIIDATNGTIKTDAANVGLRFDYTTTQEQFVGFDPIGDQNNRFTGTFDADGHTVSELVINRPDGRNVGLFGNTSEAVITDLTLSRIDVVGDGGTRVDSAGVGGIVGENNGGTVSNSSVSGTVVGSDSAGGAVGFNLNGTVSNVQTSGNVTVSDRNVSGVSVGFGQRVGGAVGGNFGGTVSNASASGDVTGSARVGGLVGSNFEGTVSNSSASGVVNSPDDFGGGVGGLVGGLVGLNIAGTVSTSSASGAVTGSGPAGLVGGLVGLNDGTVSTSSASGAVNGSNQVGGLVGSSAGGTVSESFAVGTVTGDSAVGGVIGELGSAGLSSGEEAIIRNSYFDTQTTGQPVAVGTIDEGEGTAERRGEVAGLETSEMQGASAETTMAAFDFAGTWQTVTDPADYPVLRALTDQPETPADPGQLTVEAPGTAAVDEQFTLTLAFPDAALTRLTGETAGLTVRGLTPEPTVIGNPTQFPRELGDGEAVFYGEETHDQLEISLTASVEPGRYSLTGEVEDAEGTVVASESVQIEIQASSPVEGITPPQFDAVLPADADSSLAQLRESVNQWATGTQGEIDGVELSLAELREIVGYWAANQ